jgi:hypothetical protein
MQRRDFIKAGLSSLTGVVGVSNAGCYKYDELIVLPNRQRIKGKWLNRGSRVNDKYVGKERGRKRFLTRESLENERSFLRGTISEMGEIDGSGLYALIQNAEGGSGIISGGDAINNAGDLGKGVFMKINPLVGDTEKFLYLKQGGTFPATIILKKFNVGDTLSIPCIRRSSGEHFALIDLRTKMYEVLRDTDIYSADEIVYMNDPSYR